MALKELEDTGKHSYEDTTWKDSYAKVFTDEEILEFLLSKPRVTFKGNQEKLDEIKKEREKIQKEATKDLPKGSPLGDLSKENYEKFWGALQWSREEREKLTQESRAYYENYLKKIKENK
ncbi:hypothetical protein QLX43_gp053 [Staphylococcus phage IME-SA1]|uniref:Uncharacterized protein n=1 Tax=Staphylococcus phage IME-SA1 TaxID=1610830 RepID=A0A0E3T550_9CAUD|nr:hypothetical protein QLX43_gp053 [Staphylococcus phage IME-SA1]AKC02381.1 hypothetical protein [Staphylococcus phage IME-SA1]